MNLTLKGEIQVTKREKLSTKILILQQRKNEPARTAEGQLSASFESIR